VLRSEFVDGACTQELHGATNLAAEDLRSAVDASLAGIVPSRGRTGTALDNAMAESVIATIKTELTKKHLWRTRLDLELALLTYIGWYNQRRLHRSLGGNTPNETAAYRPDSAGKTESDQEITTKTN